MLCYDLVGVYIYCRSTPNDAKSTLRSGDFVISGGGGGSIRLGMVLCSMMLRG